MNLIQRLGKWTAVIVVLLAIGLVGGGMMLSPAFTVQRSVLVNAPPERVYAYVADPRGWNCPTTSSRSISSAPAATPGS